MAPNRGKDFATIVYQILVVEKQKTLEELAAKMSLSYSALHARLSNRVMFSADEIALLLKHIRDPRLVSYLLRETPYVPIERQDDGVDEPGTESLRAVALRMIIEATDVARVISESLTDDRIDHREALRIRDEIETAERAIAAVRVRISQAGSNGR